MSLDFCKRMASASTWHLQVQSDLVKDGGHLYFVKHLESRDPGVSPDSRAQVRSIPPIHPAVLSRYFTHRFTPPFYPAILSQLRAGCRRMGACYALTTVSRCSLALQGSSPLLPLVV